MNQEEELTQTGINAFDLSDELLLTDWSGFWLHDDVVVIVSHGKALK